MDLGILVQQWAVSVPWADMSCRDKLSRRREPNWCLMLLRSNYGAQMSRANLWLYNVDTWAKERARSEPLWENWSSLLSRCEMVSVEVWGWVGGNLQKTWNTHGTRKTHWQISEIIFIISPFWHWSLWYLVLSACSNEQDFSLCWLSCLIVQSCNLNIFTQNQKN